MPDETLSPPRFRTPAPPALFSIHDVTPVDLDRVEELVGLVRSAGNGSPLLLVVPGAEWDAGSLDRLKKMSDSGCPLAGHGWSHRAPPPRSLGHRIHAAIISRDRAEHLSRSRNEARSIVERCFGWFDERGLEAPAVYTPPAWALGRLVRRDLAELPFRFYETLAGFIDSAAGPGGRLLSLPLVGFEADSGIRKAALRVTNGVNAVVGRTFGRPVRIGLHPRDLELLLHNDARRLIERSWTPISVERAFER